MIIENPERNSHTHVCDRCGLKEEHLPLKCTCTYVRPKDYPVKLSQSFRNRLAGIEQARERFLNDIKEDIDERMRTKKAKLEEIANGAGVHYSLLSAIRNGRRPATKDFIYKYTKYLEEIGE